MQNERIGQPPPLAPVADLAEDPAVAAELLRLNHLSAIRRLLGLILLVIVIMGLYFARDVILPLMVGLLLALTLSPVVRALQRIGISPPVTATALIIVVSAVILVGGFLLSGPVAEWINQAPRLGDQLRERAKALLASFEAVQNATEQVSELAGDAEDPAVQRVAVESPGILSSAVGSVAQVVTTTIVTLVLGLFLLASGDLFYIKLIEAFPRFGDKKKALRIVYGIERRVSRYLLSVTLINFGLGVVIGLAMWGAGMPSPVLWAIGAFVLNFLPYIGAVAGVALSGAVALVHFEHLSQALLVPALYLTATSIEGQVVTPIVLGRRLELNTVSVFVTVIFWGWLWGIAGALIAVPFLVCLKVVCDNVEALHVLGNFLGARDPLPDLETEPAA
ncbi:AI-2E family transporter [Cereibacter sphaeroides]|uniref:AI-2E family transporter n=1 Tax=Cereibacter sphaeroides TaxID=1063 RepID=UPI001F414198|nr:AI-2E family transporter [Cereibacter sphaeroides]MCE6959127.1 AI-2E family transporter [Cereibacter sphaeroides]MCE6968368.1 AI-2E family transporter [Cereibacter sphaeroides]MCE6974212.1 AI-2E family transporter [Cereibacter sphaeroides]